MATLIGGIFYVQPEIQSSPALMVIILVLIVLLNLQFLLTWVLRIVSVLFRLYLVRLREFTIFRFLNYIDINDYEADLKMAVKKEIILGNPL